MKAKLVIMMLIVGMATMGFDCVNDNALFAINIQGISGTYKVNPGSNASFSGSATIAASDYLDDSFSNYKDIRIYDIRVRTEGSYAGNVSGTVRVNGVTILSYNGPWSSFSTAQSLVTSPLLTRNAAGILTLIDAIRTRSTITLSGSGNVSQTPVPDGLSVTVEVLGQVDAEL